MSDITGGLVARFRLSALERHHDTTLVLGSFALINGFISIALMAGAALATGQPFIFPSLGPTAFLLFYTPMLASASPRNTVTGHLIGVLAGYLALVLFGLTAAGPALSEGVSSARVLAAALSLGVTAGVMVWLRVPHPPAGATTLIVSLGIITQPEQLAVLMLAVLLIVGQALVINRLAGLAYPLWAPRSPSVQTPPGGDRSAGG
ncbi:HPP family protein [Janibacter cremeus]|uniref:CBS-domain-containing membrane protein n=1 Tax=Janibacter cremeus TaxID=1285192 RepID=A0A852VK43_9MICO|nr:HPP family protein [Janibacter cremeus]NYF97477.1 CBS-domain-containing membrane protein [Janibacter cremeus]